MSEHSALKHDRILHNWGSVMGPEGMPPETSLHQQPGLGSEHPGLRLTFFTAVFMSFLPSKR